MSDHVKITDDEWWDMPVVCKFFGGTKPLDPATVYRHIKNGIISPPDHVGRLSRWRKSKCHADKQAVMDQTNTQAT
jgi:predicted DNA-binding transcriptional regulator AlpA